MANIKSAKKRAKQTIVRTERNKTFRSKMRTFVKRAEQALLGTDAKAAQSALKEAESALMKSVSKGIIHKNTAARKTSRLSARLKAMAKA